MSFCRSTAEDFLMVLHCPQAIKSLLFGHGVSMDNHRAPLPFPPRGSLPPSQSMHPLNSHARPPARLAPPSLIEFPAAVSGEISPPRTRHHPHQQPTGGRGFSRYTQLRRAHARQARAHTQAQAQARMLRRRRRETSGCKSPGITTQLIPPATLPYPVPVPDLT